MYKPSSVVVETESTRLKKVAEWDWWNANIKEIVTNEQERWQSWPWFNEEHGGYLQRDASRAQLQKLNVILLLA